MTIEEAIRYRLIEQITSLSGRIYPITTPQGGELPAIAFKRISTRRDPTLTTQGQYYTTFQFDVLAPDYTIMREIRDAIRAAFEDVIGQYATGAPYILAADVFNEMDGFDTGTEIALGVIEIEYLYT